MGNVIVQPGHSSRNSEYLDNAILLMSNKMPIVSVRDERGYYNFLVACRIRDTYLLLGVISESASSTIMLGYNLDDGVAVSIKIIKPSKINNQAFLREVNVLSYLKVKYTGRKEYFIKLLDFFEVHQFPCIVTELLGSNINTRLQESPEFSYYTLQEITRHIVKGLNILKDHRIVHCNLKPEHILFINSNSNKVKIIGFECAYFTENKPRHTRQRMSFRAPETILQLPYHFERDMWSLGCTLIQVLKGRYLLRGRCKEIVLTKTMWLLGLPPTRMIRESPVRERYFNGLFPRYLKATPIIVPSREDGNFSIIPDIPPQLWYIDRLLKHCHNPDLTDFVKQCFIYEPELRLTPTQALNHPWLTFEYPWCTVEFYN